MDNLDNHSQLIMFEDGTFGLRTITEEFDLRRSVNLMSVQLVQDYYEYLEVKESDKEKANKILECIEFTIPILNSLSNALNASKD